MSKIIFWDVFKYFIGPNFHQGLRIVPVVLFANLLLGIFFNLSIWYKLNNLTKYGAIITLTGAAVTFLVNWFLIPVYGYVASAWAHVACYGTMVLISWMLGRRHYPIPYEILRILGYIGIALGLFALAGLTDTGKTVNELLKNTLLLAVFIIIIFFLERKSLIKFMRNQ